MLRPLTILVMLILAVSAGAGETPNQNLQSARIEAVKWQKDAFLVLVRPGANLSKGKLECSMADRVGWYFKFYSPSTDRFYYVIACSGKTQVELAEENDRGFEILKPIPNNFVDTVAVAKVVDEVQKKRKESRCGAMMPKLRFWRLEDRGAALDERLLWDVSYQCAGDKEQSRRVVLDAYSGKPI